MRQLDSWFEDARASARATARASAVKAKKSRGAAAAYTRDCRVQNSVKSETNTKNGKNGKSGKDHKDHKDHKEDKDGAGQVKLYFDAGKNV